MTVAILGLAEMSLLFLCRDDHLSSVLHGILRSRLLSAALWRERCDVVIKVDSEGYSLGSFVLMIGVTTSFT